MANPDLIFFVNQESFHSGDERVRVRFVTPSTDILFFGDSWVRKDFVSSLVHTMEIKKSNQRGRATLTGVDLVEKGIWCAVDLSNGAHGFDSVTSQVGTQITITQNELLQAPKSLSFNTGRMDLLIIRPGSSAWTARTFDGGPADGDATQDGKVQVPFEDLTAIWNPGSIGELGGAKFSGLQLGDVILGINPDEMTYFTLQYGAFQ